MYLVYGEKRYSTGCSCHFYLFLCATLNGANRRNGAVLKAIIHKNLNFVYASEFMRKGLLSGAVTKAIIRVDF